MSPVPGRESAETRRGKVLHAYHDMWNVLAVESGKVVLQDLAWEAYDERSTQVLDATGRVDPIASAMNEGKRALYKMILLRIREGALLGKPREEPLKAKSSLTQP